MTPIGNVAQPPSEKSLTKIEISVVHLSRRDALTSLAQRGSWKADFGRWVRADAANALADPRLEALRRFAVILRLCDRVAPDELDRFMKAGFDARQMAQIDQIVAPWRKPQSRAWAVVPAAVLLLVAAGLTYRWVVASVEEEMIGLMAAGLAIVMLAPLLLPANVRR